MGWVSRMGAFGMGKAEGIPGKKNLRREVDFSQSGLLRRSKRTVMAAYVSSLASPGQCEKVRNKCNLQKPRSL